jgi:methylphosphotriester-DNA--protein-cysteine methyltransferase
MLAACLTLALASAFPLTAIPQGRLVIVTEGTKQYHRPSCPVVRDGKQKDIIAMNVGQAELRGYKAHPGCESAESEAQGGAAQSAGEEKQPPVFVYTAPGDTRYHKETCRRLGKERKKVALAEAGKKLWPCSVCRPPVRKRTPAIPR